MTHWAERWAAATGTEIVVSDTEGVAFEFWGDLEDPEGRDRSAWISPERDVVRVNYRARDVSDLVGHMLGHVLGGEHTDTDAILSGDDTRVRNVIDAAALESVCARWACGAVIPESP